MQHNYFFKSILKALLSLLFLITSNGFSQKTEGKLIFSNYFEKQLPESEGIQSKSILSFITEIESEIDELHSFMILKNAKNIASGWWSPYAPEIPHLMHSLSKSFTSTAIGLGIDEGLLELNDRVISFFPEYNSDQIDPKFKEMRIRDLLTMTTGHKIEINPSVTQENDWVKLFINTKLDYLPGNYYKYNSYATYMLSAIIKKVSSESLVDFLNSRLFLPLEIEKPYWEKSPKGLNVGGWGLKIKTEDIAKFGQLFLQNGEWEGKQIISRDWVKMATAKQVNNSATQWNVDWKQGYGFQFWKNRFNSYRGDGAFGQYCIVLPKHEMVIAITGSVKNMQKVLDIFWKEIYSKISDKNNDIIDIESQKKLNQKLLTLKINSHNKEDIKIKSKTELGKTYFINNNDFGITSIQIKKTDNGYQLNINSTSGIEKILVEKDDYFNMNLLNFNFIDNYSNGSLGDYKKLKNKLTPIASNGYWSEENTYSMKILFLDNTASANLDFSFDENEIEIEIVLKGVFGLKNLFKLSGSI